MSQPSDDATESEDSPFDQPPSRRRILLHTALLPAYITILAAYFAVRGSARLLSSVPGL